MRVLGVTHRLSVGVVYAGSSRCVSYGSIRTRSTLLYVRANGLLARSGHLHCDNARCLGSTSRVQLLFHSRLRPRMVRRTVTGALSITSGIRRCANVLNRPHVPSFPVPPRFGGSTKTCVNRITQRKLIGHVGTTDCNRVTRRCHSHLRCRVRVVVRVNFPACFLII